MKSEKNNLDHDLDRYMKSLADTFASFEDGLKRHETFGKKLLATVGKVNSEKLDIFEILKLLTKELGAVQNGLNQMQEEVAELKNRDIERVEKEKRAKIKYKSTLGEIGGGGEGDEQDIDSRSVKAFRQFDKLIYGKGVPIGERQSGGELGEVETVPADLTGALENNGDRLREGLKIQHGCVVKLERTLSKVNDRKSEAVSAIKKNRAMLAKLQKGIDNIRLKAEALPEDDGSFENGQSELTPRRRASQPGVPDNDISFDPQPPSSDNESQEMELSGRLEEGAKAVKLHHLKDNILREKIDIYLTESNNIQKQIGKAREEEEILLEEYLDFLSRVKAAVHLPDKIETILTKTKLAKEITEDDGGGANHYSHTLEL